MSSGIFLFKEDGQLIEMQEKPYNSEDLLQGYLADHPNLLAGDQIDEASPRRWLLISREASLPAEDNGCDRWFVDHLFLDQDAIPTLVEVKRSSDSRIRRAVVGQMLDYAANAIVYWPVEEIRGKFEEMCEEREIDPDEALEAFLGAAEDPEDFWLKAKTNLQAGKIRMLFVADEIPRELKRIVEFLNEQMDPAEVLAIEIKQFAGEGLKTFVPQVHGQTQDAIIRKKSKSGPERQWDEESFFSELKSRKGIEDAETARKILKWARNRLPRFWWGRGKKDGSIFPILDHNGEAYYPFCIWTYGKIEIQFQWLMNKPPFSDEAKRREFLDRLTQIPGAAIPEQAMYKAPQYLFVSAS